MHTNLELDMKNLVLFSLLHVHYKYLFNPTRMYMTAKHIGDCVVQETGYRNNIIY